MDDRALTRTWSIYLLLACYLILRFGWAVFVPGGEYPMPPSHYLSMGFDLALLVFVLALKPRLSENFEYGDPRATPLRLLYVFGIISGVGLLLIRCTGNKAWWTGHLT